MTEPTMVAGASAASPQPQQAGDVVRLIGVSSRVARRDAILSILSAAYDRDRGRNTGAHELG